MTDNITSVDTIDRVLSLLVQWEDCLTQGKDYGGHYYYGGNYYLQLRSDGSGEIIYNKDASFQCFYHFKNTTDLSEFLTRELQNE